MKNKTETLLDRNLQLVFGQRDPVLRAAAIAELYTDDCAFYEAEGEVHGRNALGDRVQALLGGAPSFVFKAAKDPDVIHNMERLSWAFGPPGAPPVATGTDVALLDHGRIHTLYTFLDDAPTSRRP